MPAVRSFLGKAVAGRSVPRVDVENRALVSSEGTLDIGSEREEQFPVQSPSREGGAIKLSSSSESAPPE